MNREMPESIYRICLYHKDLDGECTAAIVRYNFGQPCLCLGTDYSDRVPMKALLSVKEVIIVDFSISPKQMNALVDAGVDVTWIDHHQSAIEKYADFNAEIQGVRSTESAACVLAWQFYFPDEDVPLPVLMVGDRDTWTWEYGDMTRYFCAGMEAHDTHPQCEDLWQRLFDGGSFRYIYDAGRIIERYRFYYNEEYRESWAFEREVNGYTMLCMNRAKCGSRAFGEAESKYDLLCSFVFSGSQWTLSFYSEHLSARRLAEYYGGGGHPGAAGAVVEKFPFIENKPVEVPMNLSNCTD